MNTSTQRRYRLAPRGGAGLACDENGLALGAAVLAQSQVDARGARRCVMRPPEEIGTILQASYGPQRRETILRLHQGLGRAAALIEAGDLGRAGIQAVMLGFPDLTPEAAQRLAAIADLQKAGAAWETELRIPAQNTGGGRWTTSSGALNLRPKADAPNAKQPARSLRPPKPAHVARPSKALPTTSASSIRPIQASVAAPAGLATAARPLGRPNAAHPPLPRGAVPFAIGGLFGAVAAWLHQWDVGRAQQAVDKAMSRFNLRLDRPADRTAATAYVWSQNHLPLLIPSLGFAGPKLEAASQAVMRVALVRPDVFDAMLQQGDLKAFRRVMDAANFGIADYASESRVRPPYVPDHLKLDPVASYRNAVAAYGEPEGPNPRVHHLLTAEAWGRNLYIADLASRDGWNPNAASNLMFLPYDEETQANFKAVTGILYPLHRGGHYIYNKNTLEKVKLVRSAFPLILTSLDARSILDDVAVQNRNLIMSGQCNPILKVGQ